MLTAAVWLHLSCVSSEKHVTHYSCWSSNIQKNTLDRSIKEKWFGITHSLESFTLQHCFTELDLIGSGETFPAEPVCHQREKHVRWPSLMLSCLFIKSWWTDDRVTRGKNECCVTWTLTPNRSHLRFCVTLNNRTMQGDAETEPETRKRDIFNLTWFISDIETTGSLWVVLEECLSTQMSQCETS